MLLLTCRFLTVRSEKIVPDFAVKDSGKFYPSTTKYSPFSKGVSDLIDQAPAGLAPIGLFADRIPNLISMSPSVSD